jgi:hypothetical protein
LLDRACRHGRACPAIHVFLTWIGKKDVVARHKAGRDKRQKANGRVDDLIAGVN